MHAASLGRLREGFGLMEDGRERADRLGLTFVGWLADFLAGFLTLGPLQDPQELVQRCERRLASPGMVDADELRRRMSWMLSSAHAHMGDLAPLKRLMEEERSEDGLRSVDEAMGGRELAWYTGEWDVVERLSGREKSVHKGQTNRNGAFVDLLQLAQVARKRGDHAAAADLYREALDLGPSTWPSVLGVRADLVTSLAELSRMDEARTELALCRDIVAAGEDWRGTLGIVEHAEGVVAAVEGRIGDADMHFERSIEISRRYRVPWNEADAFDDWGRALLHAGDVDRGVGKLDAAIDIYRRIGAGQPFVDRVLAARPK
jgi:hypothetical protein